MVKFADRARAPEVEEIVKECAVDGCGDDCTVIVGYKKIARCSFHYQRDVDKYRGRRKSASAYVFEKGMLPR